MADLMKTIPSPVSSMKRRAPSNLLTDLEKKRNKPARGRKCTGTRINLGKQFDRWESLRQSMGITSPALAARLLDIYYGQIWLNDHHSAWMALRAEWKLLDDELAKMLLMGYETIKECDRCSDKVFPKHQEWAVADPKIEKDQNLMLICENDGSETESAVSDDSHIGDVCSQVVDGPLKGKSTVKSEVTAGPVDVTDEAGARSHEPMKEGSCSSEDISCVSNVSQLTEKTGEKDINDKTCGKSRQSAVCSASKLHDVLDVMNNVSAVEMECSDVTDTHNIKREPVENGDETCEEDMIDDSVAWLLDCDDAEPKRDGDNKKCDPDFDPTICYSDEDSSVDSDQDDDNDDGNDDDDNDGDDDDDGGEEFCGKKLKSPARATETTKPKSYVVHNGKKRDAEKWFLLDDGKNSLCLKKYEPYLEVLFVDGDNPDPNNSESKGDRNLSGSSKSVIYRCKACQLTHKVLDTMRTHILYKELAEEDRDLVACQYCGKRYTKSGIHPHERSHARTEKKEIVCPYEGCSVVFRHKYVLDTHIKGVHLNSRMFPCTWEGCGKTFKRKTTLDVHTKIHTGDKAIICYICGFRCIQKASLNWHMKKKHADAAIPEANDVTLTSTQRGCFD